MLKKSIPSLDLVRLTEPSLICQTCLIYFCRTIPSCVEFLMLVVFVILQEKIMMLQQNESLLKENERLQSDIDSLLKGKEMSDAQVLSLTKSLEVLQKDIKEKENRVTFSMRLLCIRFWLIMKLTV